MRRRLPGSGVRFVMRAATLSVALSLIGCATVDTTEDRAAARRAIADRIGTESIEEPKDPGEELGAILASGVEFSECARIAVLAHPEVAGAFARIGIARADRVQAGLLPNPSLTAGYLWTNGSGPDKRQFSLAQPIAEAFVMPNRIRASQLLLDAEILKAASIAVEVATRARASWRRVRALERALAVEDEGLALARRAVEVANARLESGAISEFDVALARSRVAASQLAALDVRRDLAAARANLAAALGRAAVPDLAVRGDEPILGALDLTDSAAFETARNRRLDAQVAAIELAAARFDAEREEGRLFLDVKVGGAFEKVVDRLLGPVLTLTLPIFDQGIARIEAARARVEVAVARERAVHERIDGDVRAALSRVRDALVMAEHLREIVVPIAEDVAARAQTRFENGADDIDPWLDALGTLLERRRRLARAELEIAEARSELEFALGGGPIRSER